MSEQNRENWKDIFGEDLSESLAEELGLDEPQVSREENETYPIDESFFETGNLDLEATNVIPPEVRDVASYVEEEERPKAIRRVRRRRTGCLGGVMYAAFILGIATVLAFVAWMAADDILGLTQEEFVAEVTIPENFTLAEVADILHEAELINHPWLFRMFGGLFNYAERIQPGVYNVQSADYRALIGRLNQRTGAMIEVNVMIPEGRMMREIFQILEYHGVSTVELLTYAAENAEFDFDFLNEVPRDAMNRLEGYLFPDTYTFFLGQNPEVVIRRMLQNFETRMIQNDVFELVENSSLSLHDIVSIGSMIEGEMANLAEAPRISSVIHNRIRDGWHLNIDATIQYILPYRVEFLTLEHTRIPSPYNTYLHTGMPYGPVSNPGVGAILAALQPESTNFFFYALHVNGSHHFTRNYDEHRAFLATPDFVHHGWGG